jgi:hypothetical protein
VPLLLTVAPGLFCICLPLLASALQGAKLEVTMAQHLLAAADRFQLIRLRCICEQRLCETVEVREGGFCCAVSSCA